jgi:uncharacterized surface protein with fasciclin (FAS1) repeats
VIQKKLVLLNLLFITTLLCTSFSAAQDDGTANYGVLKATSDLDLKTFSAALQRASLADILNNQGVILLKAGSFTIFAPSDAVINASFPESNIITENQTELMNILSYHIVWNDGTFDNITDLYSVKTLQGENLSLNSSNGLKVNGANVTASKEYDNGTIYVIDKVLIPNKTSSKGIEGNANDLGAKKFISAIKSVGFTERLNGQGLMGIESLREGPFTIFAPSDEAFDKAKAALDSISKKDAGMTTLLGYHMVDAKALNNMTDSSSVKTLQGDSLAVDYGTGMVGGAEVLRSERYNNGIIYVIDQVLIPVRLS